MDAQTIAATEGVHPLSRAAYHRLVAAGVFDDARVELLYGVVVPTSPQKAPHAATVARLVEILVLALVGRAGVRAHSPFAAAEDSEPEPDVAVVPIGDYGAEHPDTAHLLIEVSESSVRRDRGPKLRLYAAAGVPEYWIVDLAQRVVEVWRDPRRTPTGAQYASLWTVGESGVVTPAAFPDVQVPVANFLPRA